MLRKTADFINKFSSEVNLISWFPFSTGNNKIYFRGSYASKKVNSLITDIDLGQNIPTELNINLVPNRFLSSISEVNKQKSKNFIFMHVICGSYLDNHTDKKLQFPFSLDNDGNCAYDHDKAKEWVDIIERYRILEPNKINYIRKILFENKINITSVFEIKNFIRDEARITWSIQDIKKGVIEKYNCSFNFIELVKSRVPIITKYLYKYIGKSGISYCTIDYQIRYSGSDAIPNSFENYYSRDFYKIFKGLKHDSTYKIGFSKRHTEQFDSLEKFTALNKGIKTYKKFIKYGDLTSGALKIFSDTIKENEKEQLLELKKNGLLSKQQLVDLKDEKDIEAFLEHDQRNDFSMIQKILDNLIKEKCKQFIVEDLKYISTDRADKIKLALMVSSPSNSFNQDENFNSFLRFDKDKYVEIYNLANSISIEPDKMLECMIVIYGKFKKGNFNEFFNEVFKLRKTDHLSIKIIGDKMYLIDSKDQRQTLIEQKDYVKTVVLIIFGLTTNIVKNKY